MREKILELLEGEFSALDIITINDRLGLTSVEDLETLTRELDLLVSDEIVYLTNKNRYILYSKCPDFKKGRMQINKSGNGFLVLEDEEDIFIDRDNVGYALNGDIVLVKILENNGKKREGMVIKVLKRDINNLVGVIESHAGSLVFVPEDKKLNIKLTVDESSLKSCVEGEIVVVSLVDDLGKNRYIGEVKRHICHKDDPGSDILKIAANYEIYLEFPEDVIREIETIPDELSDEVLCHELEYRTDLRDDVIYTIDGVDTKDIDDAVSVSKEGDIYRLRVSIADVSFYVREGSPLDLEALRRGTSSYLAYSVLPMLPHKLSNGICSLNPGVPRLALTCEMFINKKGNVVDSNIYPSIIKSVKKMNYGSVNHILEDDIIDPGYDEFYDNLKLAQELAHIIRAERVARGASDFDMDEIKIKCDEAGKAIDVGKVYRGEGEKLIEDFMVKANETVASKLFNMDLPSIYRVHGTPVSEKVQSFVNFCRNFGIQIKGKFSDITNPKMFQSLLNQIDVDEKQNNIIKSLALRSMPKAFYGVDNIGHFGLAVVPPHTSYTHFTSPIRRYPDLLIHRLIWTYLINGKTDTDTKNYWSSALPSMCDQASKRELAAIEAERAVDKMKMAEYMESHIGEEYEAIISGVTGYGVFVQLDNLVEGLVSVDYLAGHNFQFVEDTNTLVDPKSKKVYRLGDYMHVRCIGASALSSTVDFEEIKEDNSKTKEEKVKDEKKNGRNKK